MSFKAWSCWPQLKRWYFRRGLIEGAVPTNANNSTTKSPILKSPFRGGQSSKEVLAVGNNGGAKLSCCYFGDILKLFWDSESLGCLLWRARVFCTTNDVTRFQTLVSCFSRYRPYFYPIKRNVPMLERSSFFATMMHNNSNLEIHKKKGGAFFRFMCTLKYKIGSTASVWRW